MDDINKRIEEEKARIGQIGIPNPQESLTKQQSLKEFVYTPLFSASVFRINYSLGLIIPNQIAKQFGIKRGQRIQVKILAQTDKALQEADKFEKL